jgi:hypothetical protein
MPKITEFYMINGEFCSKEFYDEQCALDKLKECERIASEMCRREE